MLVPLLVVRSVNVNVDFVLVSSFVARQRSSPLRRNSNSPYPDFAVKPTEGFRVRDGGGEHQVGDATIVLHLDRTHLLLSREHANLLSLADYVLTCFVDVNSVEASLECSKSSSLLPPTLLLPWARHSPRVYCFQGGKPTRTTEQVRSDLPRTARSASTSRRLLGACHCRFSVCARVDSTSPCAVDVAGVTCGWTPRGRRFELSRICPSFVFHIFGTISEPISF